jgi:hypothetical protein
MEALSLTSLVCFNLPDYYGLPTYKRKTSDAFA